MSQHCECMPVEEVDLPVSGLSLKVDPSVLGGLSREEVEDIVRGMLVANPGSGIVPDFRIGVETLYPGRVNGKQMYAQMIDFGALPNKGKKTIEHGIADVEWISVSEDISRITEPDGITLRSLSNASSGSAPYSWYYKYSSTTIFFETGVDRRGCSAVICLLYTKTTDPVIG